MTPTAITHATLVIPCFNEAARLDAGALLSIVQGDVTTKLLFVDDGSTDTTLQALRELQRRQPERIDVLPLATNQGKAEAVRRGLLQALQVPTAPGATSADVVGYFDADLATPPTELLRLLVLMRKGRFNILLASRVSLLGRSIERSPWRHYLGRIFASAASFILKLTVYDTQCGAKFFRRSDALSAALFQPFLSRWAFDIELLGRLLIGDATIPGVPAASVAEEPLLVWRDVAGSKLKAGHMASTALDVARIGRDLARRRAALVLGDGLRSREP